ncbi:WcaF family extracellular polysaccharide biosynthesis acetyltransferase [Paenibacillus ehimensis]|uniref:WcaF family extracellular polysaccharide biosynthesis acetyltransferase n=1 Tax=Paenibacillus ehimensis TaxID=79264 RepID=A0ABT8V5G8_9BACL|nr:WcaF family extracellular polysaccharide biosynthesis acetyltransferase [Paenibacillus ehimensis]MDO3675754.1 WcaF family extracellular polysaccharide biosynthesis acetyltransferase [Paenibacillus ehimensis]MEC0213046.1 WcaF family extracellular polysaccharide biosynthesis acetyltransferase [Paenibacillus ehimensis]
MKNRIRLDLYNQDWYSRGRSNAVVLLWWFVQGTLFRFSLHNMYGWRRFLLRLFGAKIGRGVQVRATAKFTYPWKVTIGDYSWIGDNVEFYSLDRIEVGEHCVVSQHCYLCTGSHDMTDEAFGLVTRPIVIRDGAWIASDVFVYPGVTVGVMGVVAARSTVVKDVPANQVFAGTPAKFVKERFQEKARLHMI